MKCEREKCRRKARARGLCEKHLLHAASLGRVDVGMVEPLVASRHIQFLLNHEVSFCEMSRAQGWRGTLRAVLDQARPILKETESRVLKIQPSLSRGWPQQRRCRRLVLRADCRGWLRSDTTIVSWLSV